MKVSVRYNVGGALKFIVAGFVVGILVLVARGQTISPSNLPLYFEANPDRTEFLSRSSGYEFLITSEGAQIALRNGADRPATMRMSFDGGNARAVIRGDGELAGKINYLIGNDASKWQTGLPTFSRVQVSEIYPGIDLVFHGNQQQLEYDFAIAPGANPDAIKIHFDGADKISISPDGELILKMGTGEIRQPTPEIYQTVGDNRKVISGGYKILDARTVAFNIGRYDHSLPLVIDPLLGFSSYFGLNLGTTAWAIARDNTNDFTYIAGQTFSKQFFTKGAFQTNFGGGTLAGDAFVAKFGDPATNLIYLTYLGGTNDDAAYAIAVDSSSHAFITGLTQSPNFPTNNFIPGFGTITGKIDPNVNRFPADIFVTELSPDGSSLVYSTYFGGNAADSAYGIALDSADNAYITGVTYSTNFPIFPDSASVLQNHLACSNNIYLNGNAFVAEIPSGGNAPPLYSSYLGGTNFDIGRAIAVDSNNYVYVAGYTASTNFPVINEPTNIFTNFPAIMHLNGSTNSPNRTPTDAFVTKFKPLSNLPGLSSLVYSTFLGGTNADQANGIAVDLDGNAYVTGWTTSPNFPVVFSAPNTNFPAGLYSIVSTNSNLFVPATNVFLTKISSDGSQILDSAVFGGFSVDIGYGVALDSAGDAFVVGTASSTNFPTVNTFNTLSHTNSGGLDVFVTGIKADWSAAYYSVLLGGKRDEQGYGIALDSSTNVYITGYTASTNFPTANATPFSFDMTNIVVVTNKVGTNFVVSTNTVITTNLINGTNFINGAKFAGTNDAFLAEILFTTQAPTNIILVPTNNEVGVGGTATFTLTGNGANTLVLFQWQREIFTNQIVTNIIIGVSTNKVTNSVPSGNFTNLLNTGRFSGAASNILTITNVMTNDTGSYQIILTYGGTPITNDATLDVERAPIIVVPPLDQTNVVGSNVTFTVTAFGQPPLHYQWLFDGTNLANSAKVSGATTNKLTITGLTTNNEGTFEVIVTNSFGSTNASATLTLINAPIIITSPNSQTVGLGALLDFIVEAQGAPPLHYSWTFNGATLTNGGVVSGATNSTLFLNQPDTTFSGTYVVTITNTFGSTNASATLEVLAAPRLSVSQASGFATNGLLSFDVVGGSNSGFYDLLFTNDLLAPVSTWPKVGPAQFGNQGQFSFTMSVDTNFSQQFYMLLQTTNPF
jgi:Immunoglobulin I-set domain/Beta-propeller repeat